MLTSYSLCCDDMFLFAFVESSCAFHTDIVGLCSSTGEDYLSWICSNTVGYLLFHDTKLK